MKWSAFFILLALLVITQQSLYRAFGLGPQRLMPDLLLMTGVIFAFRGESPSSLIAGWVLGLAKDLTAEAPLGCYALGFGGIALLIVSLRDWLYGENILVLMLLTALAVVASEHLVLLVQHLKGQGRELEYWNHAVPIFLSAAISGAISPYLLWLLMKGKRFFALHPRKGRPR